MGAVSSKNITTQIDFVIFMVFGMDFAVEFVASDSDLLACLDSLAVAAAPG